MITLMNSLLDQCNILPMMILTLMYILLDQCNILTMMIVTLMYRCFFYEQCGLSPQFATMITITLMYILDVFMDNVGYHHIW